jgi:hypothetical protein
MGPLTEIAQGGLDLVEKKLGGINQVSFLSHRI